MEPIQEQGGVSGSQQTIDPSLQAYRSDTGGMLPKKAQIKRSEKWRIVLRSAFGALLVAPAIVFWSGVLILCIGFLSLLGEVENDCSVARIPLQGVLAATDSGIGDILGFGFVTSANSVVEEFEQAEKNDQIQAVVIDVDSPGGTPVAGDEIMQALLRLDKPTVAVVRDQGTSAAYWAMAGADHIIASPVSDVGSIGVTMSYLELANASETEGSRWVDLSSGEFKDAGNPERELAEEEELYFQSQVDTVHDYMVDQIARARSVLSRDELAQLADGRAYLGSRALELGLVDEVGGFEQAIRFIAAELGVDEQSLSLCPVKGERLEELLR